jgi:hypothetical protein
MIPVLYCSRQYKTGDALPATDKALVDAWIEAGSAIWIDDEEIPAVRAKAIPASVPAGIYGRSSDGDPEAVMGRVPVKGVRARRKK